MATAKPAKASKGNIDWEQYGLSSEPPPHMPKWEGHEENMPFCQNSSSQQELFQEDQIGSGKPWWKANFFLSEPVLFGTWDGVFTSCMINLFSVIVFLRSGWVVGNAGIIYSMLIILTTVVICTGAALAGIGICERCHVETGGVHFLLSHVLGSRTGGAVSLVYCFGQAVSCALNVIGFGESISELFGETNIWIQRAIAVVVILFLLGINLAGVKWVIRLQFLLLIIILLAALDLLVGTLVIVDPEHGVIGYDLEIFKNNTQPEYSDHENWFTVFGVFFPAMTGILAGINMSGDLRHPSRDIPVGTLSSIGTSFFIYVLFFLGLGATCQRWALKTDFVIAEKVSAVSVLLIAGVYISAMSTCLGSLYASPRIIQCMANENVIPVVRFLGRGKGPNKVPVYALILFSAIIIVFILIGQVNTLAPVVTIPFLLTYATVEYAYFSLAMTFNMQLQQEARFFEQGLQSPAFDISHIPPSEQENLKTPTYGSTGNGKPSADLDHLFPERVSQQRSGIVRQSSSLTVTNTESPLTSPDEHSSVHSGVSKDSFQKQDGSTESLLEKRKQLWPGISSKTKSWYSIFCNRWLAIIGAIVKLVIMFLVHWIYALSIIFSMAVLWFYIGQANPGGFKGVADFKLFHWLKNLFLRCIGCKLSDKDQIVIAPVHPGVKVLAAQLTEDNTDYASRERYHHSKNVSNISNLDSD